MSRDYGNTIMCFTGPDLVRLAPYFSFPCVAKKSSVPFKLHFLFAHSLCHLSCGFSKVIALTSSASLHSQALGQPVCVCVSLSVYSLSFLASPNNSPTVINIVWRSLWPAVSGPAAQGSGSDADE